MKVSDKPSSIEAYIATFDLPVKSILDDILHIITKIAPGSEKSISYGMPAFKLDGKPLVYFAAYKNHIGFYATPTGHSAFKKELSKYKQGKGSVQFPLDQPIPFDLIEAIVRFRVKETEKKNN